MDIFRNLNYKGLSSSLSTILVVTDTQKLMRTLERPQFELSDKNKFSIHPSSESSTVKP